MQQTYREKSISQRENLGKKTEGRLREIKTHLFSMAGFVGFFFKSQRVFLYHFRVVYLKKDGMVDCGPPLIM